MTRNIYNNQIDKIDEILNDKDKFEKYINDIEMSNIKVPEDIEDNIKMKINKETLNNKNNINIKKYKYYDILKIVACIIFSLVVWQSGLSKISVNCEKSYSVAESDIYKNINEKIKNVNGFFMNSYESEEKL